MRTHLVNHEEPLSATAAGLARSGAPPQRADQDCHHSVVADHVASRSTSAQGLRSQRIALRHPRSAIREAEALAYTRWLATHHYENFQVVSFLLPKKLHQDFYNVYTFCRWADDLATKSAILRKACGCWPGGAAN